MSSEIAETQFSLHEQFHVRFLAPPFPSTRLPPKSFQLVWFARTELDNKEEGHITYISLKDTLAHIAQQLEAVGSCGKI